jgi:hypothetical protein
MKRSWRLIIFSFFFAAVAFSQTRSEQYQLLLQQAGNIFGPLDAHSKCGFPAFATLYQASLKNPEIASLFKAVFQRPNLPNSYITPDRRFRIHYTTTGIDAVDPTSTIVAGVPDYIYEAGLAAQKSYRLLRDNLGFDLPISDGSEGGGPEYDFYVVNEPLNEYGRTEWNIIDAFGRGPAYSFVDNNFVGYNTTGLAALRVTVAHEYFHGVQLTYRYRDEDVFFLEMSSVWFEDFAYDEVNDYYFYLPRFFNSPETPLPQTAGYEVSIWLHYLVKRTGTSRIVLDIWKRVKTEPAIKAFKTVLESPPYIIPFSQAFGEFNTWCYFTGERADAARYFEEGAKYPQLKFAQTIRVSRNTNINDEVPSIAANFYRVIRNPQNVQFVLQTGQPARWVVTVIAKNSQQQDSLRSGIGLTPIDVTAIPREDTMVVAVVNTALPADVDEPSGYQLQVRVDGKLLITNLLEKPRPNPFQFNKHNLIFFPFRLNQRMPVEAVILREDGRLMRHFKLGELGAGPYPDKVFWNGRDDSGNRVASGVYFFRVLSSAFHETAKFVVIN